MPDDTIPLIGGAARPTLLDDDIRGEDATHVADRVPIAKLQEQIAKLAQIAQSDSLTATKPGGFAVDEIKIVAEVTASGELGFVVAGLKADAKGSIELTFRRQGAKA